MLFEDESGRNNPLFTQRFTFPELPCKKNQKYKHLLLQNARKDYVIFHTENKPYEPRSMQNKSEVLEYTHASEWSDVDGCKKTLSRREHRELRGTDIFT